ncbi:sugar phosphate isomerase/epimerase [Propioniciclava coleopterorum]|uniref:Sugar phosphate isomerase/epimerase n=1 Tax=Propioniciclava coleopterorum TaxID=2714937 RepID=A0A6G7Y7R4_9ACTN|nr:sugar phosphate isomerase/epimerase family protein [Propioniciclava coleopterorum]QIK72833.1 sugar phosphate isomerase/epimerase [Propioniciclava coleopterorum]
MIQLGFSTIGCPDYTVDQVIDLATRSGLRGIELRFLQGSTDFDEQPEFAPDALAATRARFEDAGLDVVIIDTSLRMCSLDEAERQEQRDRAARWADIAAGLGARYLRAFGGPIPDGQPREETLDAIATGLSELAEIADARGVQLLLETHDSFSTSASILDLYARGASDKLGLLWDTLHTFRHGEDPADTWRDLGERVRHVHVKDSRVATADGFDIALMGEGAAPIDDIWRVLSDGGYDGYAHFEWEKGWHPEVEHGSVAVPHFAAFMQRFA